MGGKTWLGKGNRSRKEGRIWYIRKTGEKARDPGEWMEIYNYEVCQLCGEHVETLKYT